MKARQPELRGIPQFDSRTVEIAFGARAGLSTDEQSDNEQDSREIENGFSLSASQRFRSDAELQ